VLNCIVGKANRLSLQEAAQSGDTLRAAEFAPLVGSNEVFSKSMVPYPGRICKECRHPASGQWRLRKRLYVTRRRPTRRPPVDRIVQSGIVQRLLLTSTEACIALGMSRDQLYHLRKKGRIPFIQVSERRYYYSLDELHAWMRGEWRPSEVVG